jgi:hypothetical protein
MPLAQFADRNPTRQREKTIPPSLTRFEVARVGISGPLAPVNLPRTTPNTSFVPVDKYTGERGRKSKSATSDHFQQSLKTDASGYNSTPTRDTPFASRFFRRSPCRVAWQRRADSCRYRRQFRLSKRLGHCPENGGPHGRSFWEQLGVADR